MMKSKRYRLFDWLKGDKAIADYSKWKDLPVTNIVIDGLRALNSARLISPNVVDGKIDPLDAVQLNAYRAGREDVINMIENLDDFITQSESGVELDEDNALTYLIDVERYSKEDAQRILNNEENGDI